MSPTSVYYPFHVHIFPFCLFPQHMNHSTSLSLSFYHHGLAPHDGTHPTGSIRVWVGQWASSLHPGWPLGGLYLPEPDNQQKLFWFIYFIINIFDIFFFLLSKRDSVLIQHAVIAVLLTLLLPVPPHFTSCLDPLPSCLIRKEQASRASNQLRQSKV